MRGMTRIKAHHPKQAQPMTVEMLLAMHKFVKQDESLDVAIWAAILLSFFSFFRKSNVMPETREAFAPSKQLLQEDIKIGDDMLLVHIKWSKTIQFGGRSLEMPVMSIPDSTICPVQAYRNMLRKVKCGPRSAAFSYKNKNVVEPILYSKFQGRLRKWVAAAGWEPTKFSSHSLRRGGASLAFRAKVPTELIKVHGDWASDCYLRYLAIPLDQRIQVASQVRDIVKRYSAQVN